MEQFLPLVLGPLGTLVCLAIAVWAFQSGRVYSRSYVLDLQKDRDYWRQLALAGTSLAQTSLKLAKEKEAPV